MNECLILNCQYGQKVEIYDFKLERFCYDLQNTFVVEFIVAIAIHAIVVVSDVVASCQCFHMVHVFFFFFFFFFGGGGVDILVTITAATVP